MLIFIQGVIINNLHWLGAFHPYIYIIGLIMLPMSMPRWAEMLLGAAIGLCMDAICSTAGVHMAACVAVAYLRPLLISQMVQDAHRIGSQVCSATVGDRPFLLTLILMVLLHHSMVFLLEAWSFHHIFWWLLTTLLSSLVTIVLGFLYDRTQK